MLVMLVICYYNTEISEIETEITTDHDYHKYMTTQKFKKSTSEKFAARLTQVNLASKYLLNIANFVKNKNFDAKIKNLNKNITSNKTKHVLVEHELNELSKNLSNFVPSIVDHHVLPDINEKIYISKNGININFSYTLHPWLRI